VEALGVPLQRLNRLGPALGVRQSSCHHPVRALRGLERLTDLRQPNRAGACDLSRLHEDQPLQQCVVVVLEREIDHAVFGRDQVARNLQCERGLAQTRPCSQEGQLPRTEPAGGTESNAPKPDGQTWARASPPTSRRPLVSSIAARSVMSRSALMLQVQHEDRPFVGLCDSPAARCTAS
jgi:hypothetical protein